MPTAADAIAAAAAADDDDDGNAAAAADSRQLLHLSASLMLASLSKNESLRVISQEDHRPRSVRISKVLRKSSAKQEII